MAKKEDKKKARRITTPKVTALYAHVYEVDYGTDDYPDEDGNYNITIRLSADEAEAFFAKLEPELTEAEALMHEKFEALSVAVRKKLKEPTFSHPSKVEYDKETEEETGTVQVRFKTRATYENKKGETVQRKVPVFDSVNQPLKLQHEIGFGSEVKICFHASPYFVDGQGMGGLSLFLDAIQICKLQERGAQSAESFGFGEEEDGFVYDEDDTVDTSTSSDEETSGDF